MSHETDEAERAAIIAAGQRKRAAIAEALGPAVEACDALALIEEFTERVGQLIAADVRILMPSLQLLTTARRQLEAVAGASRTPH